MGQASDAGMEASNEAGEEALNEAGEEASNEAGEEALNEVAEAGTIEEPARDAAAAVAEKSEKARPKRRRRKPAEDAPAPRSRVDVDEIGRSIATRVQAGERPEAVIMALVETGLTPEQIEGATAAAGAALKRERANKDTTHGALWLIGGILVTAISYSAASGGGSYIVTWGAIAYGGFRLLRGLSAS